MEKKWTVKPHPSEEQITHLQETINVSRPMAILLAQRGIDTLSTAKSFFRAGLEDLHDPMLMADMGKAVDRLDNAIQNKEKILFYGDYDVDGTTSVSLMYAFFKQFYESIDYYIPDRYSEGYGLSQKGVTYAIENNFTLVVTLDCGIRAVDKIKKAKEAHIDFIICDHHTPGEILPPAIAVLDPKRTDCAYPCKDLSGCGVGFKLIQAYAEKNGIPEEVTFSFLDLLAISVACDIVPIRGENRIFVREGLKIINAVPRIGVKALIDVASFNKHINVSNLVFGIGPRINAAGRIGHAKQAVELLLSNDVEEAKTFALKINQKNEQRKDFDSSITQEALSMIENHALESKNSTVLFKNDWHKGVIGIVASRCIEKYHRPTIIMTESNEKATGSARSVPGFNIFNAISACDDLIEQFGGHQYAAGLTMPIENIAAFQEKFELIVSQSISQEMLTPHIDIDSKLDLDDINPNFYNIIKQMAPFGPNNLQPVFVSENVITAGEARILKGKHLKVKVKQEGGQQSFDLLGFGMVDFLPIIITGEPFQICYTIDENHYQGRTSLQLMLRDLKIME